MAESKDKKRAASPRDPRAAGYDARRDPSSPSYDARLDPDSTSYEPRYHPEDPTRHQHEPRRVPRHQATTEEARESAKRGTTGEAGDWPKPLVRIRRGANGYEPELRMVADEDAQSQATDEGFQAIELPEQGSDFVRFPKWKYHEDGRRQVVHNQSDEEKLEGFEDVPPEPDEDDIPVASAASVVDDSPNRPPVPVDRG